MINSGRCFTSKIIQLSNRFYVRPSSRLSQSVQTLKDNDVVIASYARTPIGSFMGSLSSIHAPKLAALAVSEAVKRANLSPDSIEEVILGNVVSAGQGQAPARQAALFGGLPNSVPCTTINKVCASGMKAMMLAAQSIQLGHRDIMLAGGFESMSNIPHYFVHSRTGTKLGHTHLIDGMIHDGLWDLYNDQHMGLCAEICADTHGFSRVQQDDYALESYNRAANAWKNNYFQEEIFPIEILNKKGGKPATIVKMDEEYSNLNVERFRSLKPAFKSNGTVTAGNASTINDGAAIFVLMSARKAKEVGASPLAYIRAFSDAARDPVEFTTAPTDAVKLVLKKANLKVSDIDFHEINEAFAVVALANMRLLGLNHDHVNVNGGAVALGHPLGASGARIVGSLCTVLKQKDATLGCASICNGGGGASAMIIERLS